MSIANAANIDASSPPPDSSSGDVKKGSAASAAAAASGDNGDADDDVIDLVELLSTCVDACRRGCEVIRNVRRKSSLLGSSPSPGDGDGDGDGDGCGVGGNDDDRHPPHPHCHPHRCILTDEVRYKILDDPRSALTEADGASQKVIVECLNSCWEGRIESGRIRIVGEEDEDHYSTDLEGERSFDTAYSEDILNHFDNYGSPRPDVEPVRRDMFGSSEGSGSGSSGQQRGGGGEQQRGKKEKKLTTARRGDEVIVFIDPMDGTREFVEGRIHNVQCLIGITLNGMPVAGAMGLPMVHSDRIEIAYGLISRGGGGGGKNKNNAGESSSSSSSSSSSNNDDGDAAVVIPVLSGVKFFEAVNPLVLDSAGTCDTVDDDDGTLRVFSGDSKKPALKLAMRCLENQVLGRTTTTGQRGNAREANDGVVGEEEGGGGGGDDNSSSFTSPPIRKIISGGCGNKILSVQRHFTGMAERREMEYYASAAGCCYSDYLPHSLLAAAGRSAKPLSSSSPSGGGPHPPTVGAISVAPPGSSSWDTAAPTAVLLAANPDARITDLLGRPLVYDGENLLNTCGVLVSSGMVASDVHDRLCRGLNQDPEFCEALGVVDSSANDDVDVAAPAAESAESR